MRKLVYAFLALFTISQVAMSLAPVTVVVRDDGMNLSVKLINTNTGEELYSETIDEDNVSTNGSGYSTFIIGEDDPDWGDLPSGLVDSTGVIIRILDNGTNIEEQRFDDVATTSARSAQSPGNFNVGSDFNVGGDGEVGGDFTVEGDGSFENDFTVGGVFSYNPPANSNEFTDSMDVEDVISNIFLFIEGDDDDVHIIADEQLNTNLPDNAAYTFIHAHNDNNYYLRIEDSFGDSIWLSSGQSITLLKINGKFYFQQPMFYEG